MRICPRSLFLLLLACLPVSAFAQGDADEWQFQITPYLWLPTIDGTLSYAPPPGGGGPVVSVGPTDWLDLINAGLLINGSVRKGRFSVFTDIVYLSLQSKEGRVLSVEGDLPAGPINIPVSADLTLDTQTDIDGLIWTLAATYTAKQTESMSLDILAGVRFMGLDASTSWNLTADVTTPGGTQVLSAQGSIGSSTNLTDGIVGVQGYFDVGDSKKWSVPYHLDIGAGSSDLTWQAMMGLSRKYRWGELVFLYRHLEYDEESSGLMQDFGFSGPAIGARFRF